VPLASVASVRETEGPAVINRESLQRRVLVEVNVRGRDLVGFVHDAQARVASQVKLPEGVTVQWGGQFENFTRASQRLGLVVPIALALIFGMLFLMFGDLRLAVAVFAGAPFALVGGVLALYLRGLPFSIPAAVGFIAVAGVAVLNGVVMASEASRRLSSGGADGMSAIAGSAVAVLRPVLTTALCAAVGFIPMAVSTHAGAEVQRPLATVVIGGVIGAMIMSLLVGRVLYLYFDAAAHWLRWLLTKVFRLPEAGVSSLLGLDVEGKDDEPDGVDAGPRPGPAVTPATLSPV
jgi:cobalt-zinc-cadmium resistance protein CzcA